MRVYLVNPGLQASFWSLSEASDITGKPGYIPNLAPPTLAALTPPDVEVVICDETVEAVDLDMPCDLVGHVVQKRHTGGQLLLTGAVQIDLHTNLRFAGIANDFRKAHGNSSNLARKR